LQHGDYLTMATLFIAAAMNHPLPAGEQTSLLFFMIIKSKDAAGVSDAGIASTGSCPRPQH
jgi:aerobic C4-dicarboxylate transport protein